MQHDRKLSSCQGKKAFFSFAEAEKSMRYIRRHNPSPTERMSVYRCRFCQQYHIGNDTLKPKYKTGN